MKEVKVKYSYYNTPLNRVLLETSDDIIEYILKYRPILSIQLMETWYNVIKNNEKIIVDIKTHYWATLNKDITIV